MDSARNASLEVSLLERYRLFRSRIEHEDSLIVQRLTWIVASQAFLFAAYAVTTSGLSNLAFARASIFQGQQLLLLHLIPLVAIASALLIYISILSALKSIRELRQGYEAAAIHPSLPLQASVVARLLGLAAPVLLPLLLTAAWLDLLAHGPR